MVVGDDTMSVEYFEVKQDFWVSRWLKKPSTKEILNSKQIIVERAYQIKIGINTTIVNQIINDYQKLKVNNLQYGEQKIDLSIVSSKMELPLPIVLLILKNKKLIK